MKKRKTPPALSVPPPVPVVRQVARGLLLALAVALPLVGGRLADWQTGLVALLAVLAAILFVAGDSGCSRREPADWAWGALLALMAVAILWAPYLHGAVLAVVQVLSYALCFWLGRALLGKRWGEALAGALALGGAIVALIALREYLQTLRSVGSAQWRVFATFFNPNLVAAYLLVSLPAGVALVARYWRGEGATPPAPARGKGAVRSPRPTAARAPETHSWARPLSVAATALMALALPLTGSKGGALGALAAALTFGWTVAPAGTPAGRRLRRWVLLLVAGVIALGLLAPPLRTRLGAAFSTQSNSTMFRYYTWGGMVRMIQARPLQGFGPGSFEWSYPPYAETGFTRLGHESYLQVATEAGLPGLAAFLTLWVLLIRALRRRLAVAAASPPPLLQGEGGRGVRLLPSAALAALAGFLVHNLVDYSWYCPAVAASLFLLVGAALAGGGPSSNLTATQRRSWRAVLPLVCLSLLALALTVFLVAQAHQSAAHAAGQAGDPRNAADQATAATRIDPKDAEAWEVLAGAWEAQVREPKRTSPELRKALEARLQVARVRAPDPTNWRKLALLYGDAGDLDTALKAAARALEYSPNYVLGLVDQSRLAAQAGREDLVAASWQKLSNLYDTPVRKYAALELADPHYLYAWDYLARQADPQGDHGRALEYRRKMAPLLLDVLSRPPTDIYLMRNAELLREGDLENYRLMADQTAEQLRATGEKKDAEWAGKLKR